MTVLTTSKGERVESNLTDAEAVRILSTTDRGKGSSFAQDLCRAFSRGRLSEKQRPWLHKLAIEAQRPPKAEAEQLIPGFAPVVALLATAAQRLKYPKITLQTDVLRVRLHVAGQRSKYAGCVLVTDGRRYPDNTFFGRITPEGNYVPGRASTNTVLLTLRALARDPAGFAAEYGRETGACCFCGLALSTDESTAVGYGPTCAEHYGLPWGSRVGGRAEAPAPAEVAAVDSLPL